MIRKPALLPLLAVLVVAATGCADAVAGSPVAGTDQSGPTAGRPTSTVSAAIDPCALLTGSDIRQLGLVVRGRDTIAGSRGCSWNKSGQYAVSIGVFDHDGLSHISGVGQSISNHPVGSHDGRQVLSDLGGCGVAMAITTLSIVDIDVSSGLGEMETCQLADQYAVLVEPRLPAEQK